MLGIVAGVVLVVGGVLAAVWPDITLWVLAVVVGIDLIISGVARIMGAVQLRVEGWGWLLFGGMVSVVVGVLALVWPGATILVLGVLLGLRMLLFGISEIMFGLALHATCTDAGARRSRRHRGRAAANPSRPDATGALKPHGTASATGMSSAVSVVSCSSVGSSIVTSRVAWLATAASNRLRASRPLPNPRSRVCAAR